MEPSCYKDFKTTRGLNYHYYLSAAKGDSITLLFCHGFPSTSYDWHYQVDFFKSMGYGLVVPDMLGYGGTDKPSTPESYKSSSMTRDVVELLDAEALHNVVAVGHDWGADLVSKLAVYYPSRLIAFGFLALSYVPPNPSFDYDAAMALSAKAFGYGTMGYWKFFCEEGADKIIESHPDSLFSLLCPSDPKFWMSDLSPEGKAKEWCLADRNEGYGSYLDNEERKKWLDNLMKDGFAAPLCWYKVVMEKLNRDDEANIPPEKYTVHNPVFFGAALRDYICLAALGKRVTQQFCPKATVVDFDTDHWVMLAEPDKVNEELLKWIRTLDVVGGKQSVL